MYKIFIMNDQKSDVSEEISNQEISPKKHSNHHNEGFNNQQGNKL